MRPIQRITSLTFLTFACSPALAQVATDEAAIRELVARWEQAWNRHDMKQLFSLVTDDAWVVVEQSSGWLIRAAQNTNLGPAQQAPK